MAAAAAATAHLGRGRWSRRHLWCSASLRQLPESSIDQRCRSVAGTGCRWLERSASDTQGGSRRAEMLCMACAVSITVTVACDVFSPGKSPRKFPSLARWTAMSGRFCTSALSCRGQTGSRNKTEALCCHQGRRKREHLIVSLPVGSADHDARVLVDPVNHAVRSIAGVSDTRARSSGPLTPFPPLSRWTVQVTKPKIHLCVDESW